jgi:tetratricopeptide (TPR) repeat protein
MTKPSQAPREPAEFDALIALADHEDRAGRPAEAAAAYRQILAIRPDVAEVHNNFGNLLRSQGKLDEAAAHYERAVILDSGLVQARNNLGNVLRDQGKLDQALVRYQEAIALRPDFAEAHFNLANVLLAQGKLAEAAAHYERTLALRPDFAEAHNNLANARRRQGKLDEALACYQQSLALRPDLAEPHFSLGNIQRLQGKLDEAAASYERALALRPNFPGAHLNLGIIRWRQDKIDEAAARYHQALALKPDYVEAHNNLGNMLRLQGKLDAAAEHYQQALALRPGYAEAQIGLAACHLVRGDYQRGWPAYEGRLGKPGFAPRPNLPRWADEPLAGRSLLLVAEQGLGDTLHFVRYARAFKERGARVVLAAQPALGRLLAGHPDLDELFLLDSAQEMPRCDFYLPLLSAPVALGTTAATIPREIPYLSADPDLINHWRQELARIEGFKIGIAWQGSPRYPSGRWRAVPLAHFAPLASLPGVRLISLQKGFGSEQVATVDFPVLDFSGRLDEAAGPFMDTAAVIRSLDLVVTSDTVIAHLAGALGVPVWVALQLSPDWRWLLTRDDSPWYPTIRLFRQTTFSDWSDVFLRITNAVRAYLAETQ